MNNENKNINLENNKVQTEITSFQDQEKERDYATIKELNVEASVRAHNDQIIRDHYDLKFDVIDTKVTEEEEKVDSLEEKVIMAEDNIKNNDERITVLEDGIWDQLRQLDKEKKELVAKLEEANATISKKEEEIKKLYEEIGSGDSNDINLKFSTIPEFTITEVMTVKDFINKNLKDLVIPKMDVLYPETTFGKDYTITIDGLSYDDLLQGKIISICVKSISDGKLIGQSNFDIKVSYNYNKEQQLRFIEEFFLPAIPTSLRNVPENMSPNYKIPTEIAKTRPLKLLLNNRDYKHFVFKIFGEMNSASYWTDFHREWQHNLTGYNGTGRSTIGGTTKSQVINDIKDLYENTSGYHNSIYRFLEKLINDSGVPCTITKKWGKTSNGTALHHIGNLVFDVPNTNLENNEIVITKNHAYYMMIDFEINNNGRTKFYRGVTLVLSDNLELYPTIPD